MDYITAAEAAEKWGVTPRQVQRLLVGNRIPGAKKYGRAFVIPADAEKPGDLRKEKQPPPQKSLADELAEIIEATNDVYVPRDNPDAILDTTDNEKYKLFWKAALAYLRGNSEPAITVYRGCEGDDAHKIAFSALAIAAAVDIGDYSLYKEIETYLKNIAKKTNDASILTFVECVFCAIYTSMLVLNMIPDWLKTGDFPPLPKQMMRTAVQYRIQYLLSVKNYEGMLAATQTAITIYDSPNEIAMPLMFFWVLRVVALIILDREDEARRYLSDAVNICFPIGFITPFMYYMAVIGKEIAQYYQNGSGSILFTDPVASNNGNPIQITTSMDNSSGVTVAAVTVTNLSMTPQTNGNLTVTLLGPDGGVLDTKLYATDSGGLIALGPEGSKTFTFTFTQAGYSVQAGYYTADPADMNADLASLQLMAVAVAFDKNILSYDLTAQNIGSTTLTAAAVNPAAAVSVLDSSGNTLASGTGVVSYGLKLPSGAETDVQVQVQPVSGGTVKIYALNITNTVSGSGGIVISASGKVVTVTNADTSGFVPAAWQVCTDGVWSAQQNWNVSGSNSFQTRSEPFTSLYVRVYDANGTYMDSNSLSSAGIYCTVTFDPNGGARTGGGGLIQTILAGSSSAEPTVERDGYTFAGWFTAASGGTQVPAGALFTADTTVYAHWASAGSTTYTVTFDANGGSPAVTTITVAAPSITVGTLPATPARADYTFAGWNTRADGSGTAFTASTPVAANITVYAQWAAAGGTAYTVTYDAKGGSPAITTTTVTAPATTVGTLPAPPVRANYTFAGWNTRADGSGTAFTASTPVAANITVYAQWTYRGDNGGGNGGSNGNYYNGGSGSVNASLGQSGAAFDKNGGGDITFSINPGSYTLTGLKNGNYALVKGTDYTVSGNTVTIKASYLKTLASGAQTITFNMSGGTNPTLTVTITDTSAETIANPFSDVKKGDWFYNAVMYTYSHGLMVGTSTDPVMFSPNMPLTRGMIVTILYREAGKPDVSKLANPFSDVASGQWYTDAVKWAAANGIVAGIGGGKYDPGANITRQDLAVILYRYAQFAGIKLPVTKDYAGFSDDADIANYAKDAIDAFFKAGIISGYPDGSVQPFGEATRAEVAAMLQRFLELKK